jgi:hypothetical protein
MNREFNTGMGVSSEYEFEAQQTPERELLRAMLIQAMMDLSSPKIEDRHGAYEWFLHRRKQPRTFRWVCWWLEYDARKILRELRPLLRLEAQRRYRPLVHGEQTAMAKQRRRLKWKQKEPARRGKLGYGRFIEALQWARDAEKQRSFARGDVFVEGG